MSNLQTFATLDDAILKLRSAVQGQDYSKVAATGQRVKRDIYPARYDQSAINNIADQIAKGVGFTDRQQELTIKLITKYRRQWKKIGYDVSNIDLDTPVKHKIRRDVDREQFVSVADNYVCLKFPYKPKLIAQLAEHGRRSKGSIDWYNDVKLWKLAITADNVYWAKKLAEDHKFEFDKSFTNLIEQVDNAYDYKSIQLDIVNQHLILHNAPETMIQWIQRNIGLIEMRNFVKLVGAANMLAFTLSDEVIDYTIRNYPNLFRVLLQRQTYIDPTVETLNDLLLKVKQLDYDKVVFFISDPRTEKQIAQFAMNVLPNYNIWLKQKGDRDLQLQDKNNGCKQITITNKVMADNPDLIISLAGFMAGPTRKEWFNRAAKVIYYCRDIDNKIKKIIKKDESNFNNKRRN